MIFFSEYAIPLTILLIVGFALRENINTFDVFLEGAKEGIQIIIKIFPTLIGLFVAIYALRSSGLINFIINIISPITNLLKIPKEILPLAFLRPISRQCITCYWSGHNENIWCR